MSWKPILTDKILRYYALDMTNNQKETFRDHKVIQCISKCVFVDRQLIHDIFKAYFFSKLFLYKNIFFILGVRIGERVIIPLHIIIIRKILYYFLKISQHIVLIIA